MAASGDDFDAVDDDEDEAARYGRLIASKRLDGMNLIKTDRTLSWFVDEFKKGSLNLKPRYQRDFTWSEARSSRLVVTALCTRFIPPIVLRECTEPVIGKHGKPLANKKRTVYELVDGKQRISSLLAFALGPTEAARLGLPARASTLAKLDEEEYDGWNGMTLADLDTFDQEKFLGCALSTLCIPPELDLDRVYAVYEDINSGAENLSPHQLRRAVLAGSASSYIDMIDRLRDDEHFRAIYGEKDERKEMDGELVLRALAFAHGEYKAPLKSFLSHELQNWQKRAEVSGFKGDDVALWLVDREKAFRTTMRVGRAAFGDGAFKKWDAAKGKWALSPPFFELTYAVLSDLLRNGEVTEATMVRKASALREAVRLAFSNEEHVISAKHTKRSVAAVRECKRALEDLILGATGVSVDSVRTFGPELRRTLWESQHGLCGHCGELIDESALEYGNLVHIDHVVPHAHGGSTTPGNAQLLHAACNRQKGARGRVPVPSDDRDAT